MNHYRRLRLAASCRTNPREDPGAGSPQKKTNKGFERKQFQGLVSALIVFCLLLQSISPALAATFTAGMAKRDAPGPFAAAPIIQGDSDTVTFPRGTQINGGYYQNLDRSQGTVVLFWTPEFSSGGSTGHAGLINTNVVYLIYEYDSNNRFRVGFAGNSDVVYHTITAGETYMLVVRWDEDNLFQDGNHVLLSINDVHHARVLTPNPFDPIENISLNIFGSTPRGIIEGLTIYRRPLFDGTYGIDVGNGDEIAQIYNSGAGKDPTLVTGSWDVVFALPTNSSPGALTTGTGNAWSHPHSSNLLYTSTTNTGGFMMNGNYAADGWNPYGALAPTNGMGSSLDFGGTEDFVTIPDSASLKPGNGDWTVSVWANPENIDQSAALFSKYDGAWEMYGMYLANQAGNGDGKYLHGYYYQDIHTLRYFRTTAPLTMLDGNWHQFSMVMKKSNNSAKLYVDGVELITWCNCASAWPTIDNTDPLYIGGGNESFEMDDVRIFSRVLTENEIKSTMYKSTLSEDEMEGLVGWWKMNEASGQAVNDSSGNNNNGTLGADANAASDDPTWSTDTPTPSISALATNEKIFAGGYKYTSNGANQGISRSFTATNGGDYVLRALGHSDSTCSPQVKITRADGTTEISHLNGTTTSTRTDPDVYVFTWESPAAEANQVQLLNTASSGTCYWHQVEVLPNLVNNPSLESGSGDPWIPTGWWNSNLDIGDTEVETSVVHSGVSSLQFNAGALNEDVAQTLSIAVNKFFDFGGFFYGQTVGAVRLQTSPHNHAVNHYSTSSTALNAPQTETWTFIPSAYRKTTSTDINWAINAAGSSDLANPRYADDVYIFLLDDVSLTVTPASLANSTESTGVRVDGADSYIEPITTWSSDSGYISFDFTPRHSSANMRKFLATSAGETTYFRAFYDFNNYIDLGTISDNFNRLRLRINGTYTDATWNHTGVFVAGTTYSMRLEYDDVSARLYVDDILRVTSAPVGGLNWGASVPNVFRFGSDGGISVIDATFDNIVFDNTAPSITLTALTPDPNSDITPTLTGTANEAIGTVASVEFQMDGTGGAWSACSANVGGFDEASESFSCTPSTLADGSHTLYVRATDSNGNTTAGGSESSYAFVVDATAPSVPGTPATTSPTADTTPTWSFTASTDATAGLADPAYTLEWSQDNTFADGVSSATTNTNSFTHSTPLGDATWYVRVKATDLAGNQSAWSDSGSVQINTGAPTGSVSINAGSGFTNSRSVTLTLSASSGFFSGTGDIDMKLSNLSDLSDGAWEAFTAAKAWTLAEGDGVKTVYVQFKDATDNESGAYTDTIVLDTLAPNEATELNPGNNHTGNNERPTFSFKPATDAASGINRYKLVIDNPGDSGFTLDSIAPGRSEPDSQPRYTVAYEGFGDDRSDNDRIHITTKSSTAWGLSDNDGKLAEGVVVWSIVAVDNAGNERLTSHRYVLDRTNPRLSVDSIGSTPITSSYMATSDVTPTLKGTLTDPLAGVDTSQAQSEHGPKVSSGPRSVEVQIEKRSNYTYQPHLVYTLTLDDSYWSCNQTVITDNTKQTCDKYAPFSFTPPQALEQGSYRVTLTGLDNASNRSTQSQLTLDIVPYTALTTPQEQAVIEDTIAQAVPELSEEETEEITQELEIAVPTDAPLTREVADRGASVVTTTIEALGNAAKTIITTSGNALTTVAKTTTTIIVNRVKFVANIGTSVANLTSRVVSQLAQGIYTDSTRQLAFIVRSVSSAYGFVAGNAPKFTRSTLQAFGASMQTIADRAVAMRNATQTQVALVTKAFNQVTRTGSEAVAHASFALGERAQDVSDTVGLAIIKATYNLVTEPTTIANVQATVLSPTTVKISWDTNHPANGKVNWGFASGQYEFEAQTSKRTTNHEFTLENLEPGTNYHYEVMSQNKNYVYDANREFQTPPVQ